MSTYEEAFGYFATYAGLAVVKMMALGPLTSYHRITRSVYVNEEDLASSGSKDRRLVFNDTRVERILRCSRNDMENIIPFVILGGLFAGFSGAPLSTIVWHYRVFVAARYFHTFAYLLPLPQPCRALAWLIGFATNLSMAARLFQNNWLL